jgi:hypothetical protein
MPNTRNERTRAAIAASVAAILGPLASHDWQRGDLTDDQVDAMFARLIPVAEQLDEAVVYRLQVSHVDVYGDPDEDSRIAAIRCDLLIREQRQTDQNDPARQAYARWLEIHNAGQESDLAHRAAVLRHLVRFA